MVSFYAGCHLRSSFPIDGHPFFFLPEMMAASIGAGGGGTWRQADDEGEMFVSIPISGLVAANDCSNWLLGCFGAHLELNSEQILMWDSYLELLETINRNYQLSFD